MASYGWKVQGQSLWPFNSLVRCTLDVHKNQVIYLEPLTVSGAINHVNDVGETWLMSDIVVKVVEGMQLQYDGRSVSKSVSFELENDLETSIQHRNSSYLIHDPDGRSHEQLQRWEKGLRMTFNLKLSGRTNWKAPVSARLKFVQCWNVKQ